MSAPHALITGGQQGIGLGIARALAGAGFRLTLAAEQPEDAPAVAEALARLGPDARYLRHDLADLSAIPALMAAAGPVDTFVSNAGVPARIRGDMLELTPGNWDWTLSINLRGAFFLAQAVARQMLAAPSAHYRSLIFVTSISAEAVSIERAEYCISKAGAAMMARLFAARLAPHGIGAYELRPGIIATPMTAAVAGQYSERIAGGLVPMGRWGQPGDVGSIVLPLARGELAFATGATIPVDGGLSIPRL